MATLVYPEPSVFPKRKNTRVSSARVKLRSMSAEKWERLNFKLSENELAYDKTTRRLKIGDGVTLWNDLPYLILDVGGNFQGIMTLAEFNLFYAAYEQFKAAESLRFDAQVEQNLSFTNQLTLIDNKVIALEAGAGAGVDLSGYISSAVFEQYQTAQNTLNNYQSARLDAVEAVNATQSQINEVQNQRISTLENEGGGGSVDTSRLVTLDAFNTYKNQNDSTNTAQGQNITTLQNDLLAAIARILALENGAGSGGSGGGNNNGGLEDMRIGNILTVNIQSSADVRVHTLAHGLNSCYFVQTRYKSTAAHKPSGASYLRTWGVGECLENYNLEQRSGFNSTDVIFDAGGMSSNMGTVLQIEVVPIGI